jgi:hypothetical protein
MYSSRKEAREAAQRRLVEQAVAEQKPAKREPMYAPNPPAEKDPALMEAAKQMMRKYGLQ